MMQSMLEERYMGNVGFDSAYYDQNSSVAKVACKKRDSMEKLLASLHDPEKELFEQYCDAQGDMEEIIRYNTYTDSIRFGILLMAEVFMGVGYGGEAN